MTTITLEDIKAQQDKLAQMIAALQAAPQAERRAQLAAIDVCHRAFGPQTAPAEDVDGRLVCVDARGQRAQPARFAPAKPVRVATAQEARP